MGSQFRDHLFPMCHPRIAEIRRFSAAEHGDWVWNDPHIADTLRLWHDSLRASAFRGITSDGEPRVGLFDTGVDEQAPTAAAMRAAHTLLGALTESDCDRFTHSINSTIWRTWMSPEWYVHRFGLRLEDLDDTTREMALDLVRASVSTRGYDKIRDIMRVNGFLGEITGLPRILNEFSYSLNLFGTPSLDQPWGWSLVGHHLCVACVFVGAQQVLTPMVVGAEPNEIDTGEHAGTTVFADQEQAGLALVRALPPDLARQAILFDHKRDPSMPPGRVRPHDELQLGGSFQDNRVIPYEGLQLVGRAHELRERIVELVEMFLAYHPDGPRAARLAEVRRHLDDTWFCWIGGTGEDDPFYYRVHSPVIMVEFDHHAGIFLRNSEPARFHVHTVVRTPNGNDYGAALIHAATAKPHLLDDPA